MKQCHKILTVIMLILASVIIYLRFTVPTTTVTNNQVKQNNRAAVAIMEDIFEGNASVNKPIGWSTDSEKLYYISYYQDEAVPVEVWEFENGVKSKISELSYRKQYNSYHLGVSVLDFAWSPTKDKLAFILEYGWGDFYQLVILDEKTKKITSVVDYVVDFDWHPNKNQLVIIKKVEPHTLNTVAVTYDLRNNQLKQSPLLPQNISSIAFDQNEDLYYATIDSGQVYKIEDSGQKQLIGQGLTLIPSLDRTIIALIVDSHISWLFKRDLPETVSLYSVKSKQLNEVLYDEDIYNLSWGLADALQLVTPNSIFYLEKGNNNFLKVNASNPSTPAPDNTKFLASDQTNNDLINIFTIVK